MTKLQYIGVFLRPIGLIVILSMSLPKFSNAQEVSECFIKVMDSAPYPEVKVKYERYHKYIKLLKKKTNQASEPRRKVLNEALLIVDLYKNHDFIHAFEACHNLEASGKLKTRQDSLILNIAFTYLYLDFEDYRSAESYLLRAIEIQSQLNISTYECNKLLLFLYWSLGEQEKSIPFLKDILDDNGTDYTTLLNIGNIYKDLDQIDSAEFYLNRALDEVKNETDEIKGRQNKDFIHMGLGNVSYERKAYLEAIYHYRIVILDTVSIVNWFPYVNSYYYLVKTYEEMGEMDSCKFYLDLFYLSPILDHSTLALFNEFKSEYYEKLGEVEKARYYFELASIDKDSLIAHSQGRSDLLSKMKFDQINLIKENLSIKEEKIVVAKQKNQFLMWLTISLIVLSLVTLLFFILRLKKKRELFKLNQELMLSKVNELKMEEKTLKLELDNVNKDLGNFATNLVMKREFINDQQEGLKKIMELDSDEIRRALKMHLANFNSYENLDSRLSYLQQDIEKINSNLFTKLKGEYAELTQNDIDICALHLLRLSTKEIATLRNVTPKAIQITRYRIKKKMKLSKEEDLIEHLNGLL